MTSIAPAPSPVAVTTADTRSAALDPEELSLGEGARHVARRLADGHRDPEIDPGGVEALGRAGRQQSPQPVSRAHGLELGGPGRDDDLAGMDMGHARRAPDDHRGSAVDRHDLGVVPGVEEEHLAAAQPCLGRGCRAALAGSDHDDVHGLAANRDLSGDRWPGDIRLGDGMHDRPATAPSAPSAAGRVARDGQTRPAGVWQVRIQAIPSTSATQLPQSPARHSVPPRPGCSPARSAATATELPAKYGMGVPSKTISAVPGRGRCRLAVGALHCAVQNRSGRTALMARTLSGGTGPGWTTDHGQAATVEFDHVTKVYGPSDAPRGQPPTPGAVNDLSPDDPRRGKICVLVGPSGCGKTTSLKMVNRLIEPTSGPDPARRRRRGRRRDVTELRRGIGYVIQQTGLFPHQTIVENVGTVPAPPGLAGDARSRSARRSCSASSAWTRRSTPAAIPSQLSGGERQRVGVARALAADPPIMLMDEPFGAVDPIVRERLQNEFLRLQEDLAKTILFVTHDIDEAIKMGDLVAVFQEGGRSPSSGRRPRSWPAPRPTSSPGSWAPTAASSGCR